MIPPLRKTAAHLGYDDLSFLFQKTAWLSGMLALATIAGKFFVSDLNFKSHLTFGQLSSLTFNLIHYNDHIGRAIKECKDPTKKNVFFVMHYIAFSIIPVAVGKLVVNRYFESISWMQAAKREVYFGGFALAILCANELYKRK